MASMQFCYNGDFFKDGERVFGPENRAFRYGDSLFETILSYGSNVFLLEEHMTRLKAGMTAMGMDIPLWFDADFIRAKIERLLQKNLIVKGGRVRLSVFRNEGGLYTPSDNGFSYCIEAGKIEQSEFVINKGNYSVDIFEDMQKHPDILSPFKTGNSNLFIMAGLWRKRQGLEDCLILNTSGHLCESVSSNIFLAKGNTLYTPSIESGCVDGIMRSFLIETCSKRGLKTVERDCLGIADIMEADELFLTNSITGIRRVLSFRDKRFYSLLSRDIVNWLNEDLFGLK